MKLLSLLTVATISVSAAKAQAAPTVDTNVKALMRDKLTAAHGLLDALALEDYKKMEHFASMLQDLSKATTWSKPESPDFQFYSKSFQNASAYVVEQAKAHNLEGVTVGYVRVTLECVQCHKFVRSQAGKH
jgi:cytochrome c556